MNLLFRVLWVMIAALFKPRLDHVLTPARLTLRVLPNDLDTNLHMNNGRYLTIMDLGRFDLILRTGLYQLMLRQKSVPILAAATIRYRLPLDPFVRYHLETRVVCWNEKWVFMEQRFVLADGEKAGQLAAVGLVKGSFFDNARKTTVPTQHLLDTIGIADPSPPFPPEILAWQLAEETLRTAQGNGLNSPEKTG